MEKTNDKITNKILAIVLDVLSFIIPVIGIVRIAKKGKGAVGGKIVTSIFFCIFWLYSIFIIYALFWTFYNSLKTDKAFYENMLKLPQKISFENYAEAYKYIEYNDTSFFGMFINSLWFAAGASVLSVLMHTVTGYIFAKYNFIGKEIAFSFVLFTIALPIVGSLPSQYKVIYTLGLNDSPLILITFLGGFGGNFLITYAFFKGVDKTYMEAAQIDGAGRFCIFAKIMLPLAIGPFFALFLLSFITQWNNYETAILFLDNMPTLASGLYQFSELMRFSDATSPHMTYFAGVMMSALPVVLIVIFFGNKLMENVSVGGIKG